MHNDKKPMTQQDWIKAGQAIDKVNGLALRQLAAYAVSTLSKSELDALEEAHRTVRYRKAANRVRHTVEELQDVFTKTS